MLKPAKCVILITVDSLRQDHLGCYGYGKNTSPNMDRLAERSVIFEQAITNAPYTKASFKSIMTSTYPFSLGGYHTIKHRVRIAQVLKQSGYDTAAFPTIPLLSASSGYACGFDSFEDPFKEPAEAILGTKIWEGLLELLNYLDRKFRFDAFVKTFKLYSFYKRLYNAFCPFPRQNIPHARGNLVTQAVISTLTNNKDRRLFIWAHYMDVHHPYSPPLQIPDEYLNQIPPREVVKLNWKLYSLIVEPRKEGGKMAITQAELEKLIKLYDGEIKYVDEQIGSLLDELMETGLLEDTLIIITADHGEEFWEHGSLGHIGSNFHTHMYDELLRVPLLISHPQLNRHLIKEQVSLLDIAPTIVDMLGLPQIKEFQGTTLLPLINREEKREGAVISEASAFNRDKGTTEFIPADDTRIVSYRTQDWKYIYNEGKPDELYSLKQDPGEQQNLIDKEKELAEEFKSRILSHILAQKASQTEQTKERIRELKRLGKI